ncbi:MAG: Chorismate binding-like protein [Conexibacter sp.]|nr:Chorismate binding-like protein [Conexibacter sp.]
MTAVRLVRVSLDSAATPQQALRALAGEPWPFALVGAWAGGGAIVGSHPLRVAAPHDDPFALLDQLPHVEHHDPAAGAVADGAVGGGWFGWLGYGLGARVESLPPSPPRPAPLPPFQLAYYDHVLRRDAGGRWWFEALATPAREAALRDRVSALGARLAAAASLSAPAASPPGPFRLTGAGAAGHVSAVAECGERIAAGEIFQANVCLRLEADWDGDVAGLFAQASAQLEPRYGAAFPTADGGVASCSPELFLRRRGRAVTTAPIKGTAARDGGLAPTAATVARDALVASAKDRAENVMIVDLMRNDLGRVSDYGSIEAAAPAAEPHPGVWHLVSRVSGRLRADAGDADLLRATFPPGSVTGAPKVEAMRVIAELESTGREAYTGAIGFASPLAGLELNVAIRTFEASAGRLWLGVGGGIVADSDPARELEECLVKARPLVAAIESEIEEPPTAGRSDAGGEVAPAAPVAPRALTRDRARPDPARGVFETLLVRDGVAVRAAEHLARLAASVSACWDAALPSGLAQRVADAASTASAAARSATLRVAVGPPAGPTRALAVEVELGPPRRRTLPVPLVPFTLPGGLGEHKWRDRRLLETLARIADGATPLLLDGDGAVLEAAWGNVFLLDGDRLRTPPLDGRILPGVTRAAVLRAADEVGLAGAELPFDLAELAAADGILLSSALAGVVPAVLRGPEPAAGGAHAADGVDERVLEVAGELSGALAATSEPMARR